MCSPTTHVFIVSCPVQGQINPLLRLAKRLASNAGFLVTFATTSTATEKMIRANEISPGHLYSVGDGFLRFDFFDIDFHGPLDSDRFSEFCSKLEHGGQKEVPGMLQRLSEEGRPVSCLINGSLVPWICDVAEEFGIPWATLWPQSCASFLTFYYSYNRLVPFPTDEDLYCDVEIPTLPLLKWDELHSFLHPACPMPGRKKAWLREFQNLNKAFCVLIDTFDDLEHDILSYASQLCPSIKSLGPLFRDPNYSTTTLVRADLQKADSGCLEWLDSKPTRSVVYLCFGSRAHIKQEQVDEIMHGILSTGAPFLWVMKPPERGSGGFNTLLDKVGPNDGLVVEYSPQEQVLAHPSVACFVTHCGWNSTVEALASGVPMLAFPQWGDQLTDAKFLVDVFGVAVRLGRGGHHNDKVVPREEVERCIREVTVGPRAEDISRKAMTWKRNADKACQRGGSSHENLCDFVEDIRRRSSPKLPT